MLPDISAFLRFGQKRTGGVAGLPHRRLCIFFQRADGYFAVPTGLEKYLKKSLSGLSSMVEPPVPNACL